MSGQEKQTAPRQTHLPWLQNVWQSFLGNIHRCCRWLPCIKGRNRVHPTSVDAPNSEFLKVGSNKRIRIVHVFPDPNGLVNLANIKQDEEDHVDSGDRKSLESTGGNNYWFMRWNRPLKSVFQRNSCNCSFRRSQIRSVQDTSVQDAKRVNAVVENGNSSKKTQLNQNDPAGPFPVKHSVSNSTALEEEPANGVASSSPGKAISSNTESNSHNHPIFNDAENITLNLSEKRVTLNKNGTFCGYVNPNFLGSNGNLDSIATVDNPPAQSHDCCDNATSCAGEISHSNDPSVDLAPVATKENNPDHNANDFSKQTINRMNAKNKLADVEGVESAVSTTSIENAPIRKKHRKTCNSRSKGHLQKPLLVMIHGAGSSCDIWRGLIECMTNAGYECVAPDLLGHGLSSAPDQSNCYVFHSFLEDLLFVFDHYVTERRKCVVIGHGYGCSIAAAIARYRPEQVTQLVLISGGGPTPLAPQKSGSISPCMQACLEPLLMCGFKREVVYSLCGKQMEPCTPETSAVPRHVVKHMAQGHVWPEGDAAFHRRIAAPTLLVHGMRDPHITLVQQCEMERTIPRSFLEVIPEAGHWAMLETANALSHMVLCFIDWWAPS